MSVEVWHYLKTVKRIDGEYWLCHVKTVRYDTVTRHGHVMADVERPSVIDTYTRVRRATEEEIAAVAAKILAGEIPIIL